LAERVKNHFNTEVEYIKGSGGIFDVYWRDQLIFSKHQAYRFPEEAEILEKIKAMVG